MTNCTSESCCETTNVETTNTETASTEVTSTGTTYRPAIDVVETEAEYRLDVDLPGAAKEDVDVDVNDGVLTIRGRVAPRHPEGSKGHLQEYGVGNFERRISLGKRVDADGIRAELSDGQLTLHLPKVSAARPRRIELA